MRCWILLAAVLLGLPPAMAAAASTIPFVGCNGSFQPGGGLIGAPRGRPLAIDAPPAVAAGLALYAANWVAVLAPRGWRCIDLETENSAVLYIWPPGGTGDPRAGQIVSVLRASPLESYDIDKTYFPAVFAKYDTVPIRVAALARYKSDVIKTAGPRLFSYITPAGQVGLGTTGLPGGASARLPAYGVVAHSFGSAKSLGGVIWLNIRLPVALTDLRPEISGYLARCLPDNNSLDCESGGALVAAGSEFDGD